MLHFANLFKEEINPHPVRKMFEMEFPEGTSTQEALSQKDKKFFAIIETDIQHSKNRH